LREFIAGLAIPEADKALLLKLTPATYIGAAQKLAAEI
jgi:adenylosuccinate lyase